MQSPGYKGTVIDIGPEFTTLQSYEMSKEPRGLCVIFNVEAAMGLRERKGSQLDAALLTSLFTQLHFEIQHYKNLSSAVSMKSLISWV